MGLFDKNEPARTPSTGGGISIPTAIGISTGELSGILQKFSTLKAVEEHLLEMGFPRDGAMPKYTIPAVTAELLNEVDSKEYSTAYAHQLGWFTSVAPIMATVKSAYLQAQNQLDIVEATIKKGLYERRSHGANKMSEKEMEIHIITDPTYQDALLEVQQQKQHLNKIETYLEIIERNMRVLSRQIEMKRIDVEGHLRENNAGRTGTSFQPKHLQGRGR